jgi:hypothetical protein
VRARFLVVAVLMLAVPMQAVAAITGEHCVTAGQHEVEAAPVHDHHAGADHSLAPPHHQAPHDHAPNDTSGGSHCVPGMASISAAPKISIAAVPQAGVLPGLFLPSGSTLARKLDRPPLAL